jgi:hypothetical protein
VKEDETYTGQVLVIDSRIIEVCSRMNVILYKGLIYSLLIDRELTLLVRFARIITKFTIH